MNTTLPAFCQRRAGPRLKKLYLLWGIQIYGSKKLLVDADALSELILLEIVESNLLKHNTTNLRVLRINDCVVGLGALSIFAPRMKEVTFLDNYAESELIEGTFLESVASSLNCTHTGTLMLTTLEFLYCSAVLQLHAFSEHDRYTMHIGNNYMSFHIT